MGRRGRGGEGKEEIDLDQCTSLLKCSRVQEIDSSVMSVRQYVCLSTHHSEGSYLGGGIVCFSLIKVDNKAPLHQMITEDQPALCQRKQQNSIPSCFEPIATR